MQKQRRSNSTVRGGQAQPVQDTHFLAESVQKRLEVALRENIQVSVEEMSVWRLSLNDGN